MPLTRNSRRQPDREQLAAMRRAVSYRIALPVTRTVRYPIHGHCYPLCPRCRRELDREYMRFCDRCGQRLNWARYPDTRHPVGHELHAAPFGRQHPQGAAPTPGGSTRLRRHAAAALSKGHL